ncbi:hypothetical protein Y1Q_0003943 [Alligator mississippiensis]|uniref:Echinoderm microtubule-associated protein-like 1 n=1 Tax=Alligator mississippiensis TaxID=8496 RepID=A0A151M5V0_ALLMI|nr:hypothetical protein Y1Q_0003943 [Alligator mississippiensis]
MALDERVAALEQRLQLQDEELQVLKAALADALRRLAACEEPAPGPPRRAGPRGWALPKGPPGRAAVSNGPGPPKRPGGCSTSPSSPKKEAPPAPGRR